MASDTWTQPYFAKRTDAYASTMFTQLERIRRAREADGLPLYNLFVGTPDMPPDAHVIAAVREAALDPDNYKYALLDTPPMVEAVRRWYARRFGVSLRPEEILGCAGTQEGVAHIALAFADPGDVVLAPNPGYPIFSVGPRLMGADVRYYDLLPENGYLPDLDALGKHLPPRTRAMVLSYPSNPTGAVADAAFFERLAAFGHEHGIWIIHDNAYADIAFGDTPCPSFLAAPGAMDVGVEFNSLSKTYCLTGLRISFALGNREIIERYRAFRTQIDYGISGIDQAAAIAALTGPQDIVERNRTAYRRRRDAFVGALCENGWDVPETPASMFTWFPVPASFGGDDVAFCMALAEKAGVLAVPGRSAGAGGEGWVRFALVAPEETLVRAAVKIAAVAKG